VPDRVRLTHDPLGRVRSAFDEEGREARRTLDMLGRMRHLLDPNSHAHIFTYYGPEQDVWLQQACDALNRCTTFDYDANGNLGRPGLPVVTRRPRAASTWVLNRWPPRA
jgi:uncharacterized protein RhaS with RHS repeats